MLPSTTFPPAMPELALLNKTQIAQALHEAEAQLTPVAPDRLKQIVCRLMLHFSPPQGEKQARAFYYYLLRLKDFPEDLLCAAYHHLVKTGEAGSMPTVRDLVSFMEPEMQYRMVRRQRLEQMLRQAEVA